MFVTFEGPEGSGKSTVLRLVANRIVATGRRVHLTREPGEGEFGAQVRALLLHGHELSPYAEVFLFMADRAEHVQAIRKWLEEGGIVLCDRYADSTIVYQGYGRGLGIEELRRMNALATGGLEPDLTLLLDVPADVGLRRVETRQTALPGFPHGAGSDLFMGQAEASNRLDAESLTFHEKVRDGFLAEAGLDPERWRIVDASRALEAVVAESIGHIERMLDASRPSEPTQAAERP